MQPKFTFKNLRPFCIRSLATALILFTFAITSYSQHPARVSGITVTLTSPQSTYTAGQNNTFTFNVGLVIQGAEYVDRYQFVFPAAVTIVSGTPASGANACASNVGTQTICAPNISWTKLGVPCSGAFTPTGCGVYNQAASVFTVTVSIPAGFTGPLTVTLNSAGDGFGAPPHTATNDITFVQAVPCSGTPNPGNTNTTATSVCPTIPFTLSLANPTNGIGVTYQWQSATAGIGGPYTNIPGATSSTLTTTQTVATWYKATVTCATGPATGTSNPVGVAILPPTSCYCTSNATSIADEDIFNVTVGTLNNSSTCASVGPGPGSLQNEYSNYTSGTGAPAAPEVYRGLGNPVSVQVGTCGGSFTNSVAVWIDFDQSGSFEAAEKVYVSAGGTVGPHTETGIMNVPASALLGITRMRVVNVETGTPGSIVPCGTYTWGETEDYLVNIVSCVQGVFTTQPSNATIQCSGNTSFTVAATGSLLTYSWEYRVNASSPWLIVNNGGIYSGATTSTLTLLNVPATNSGYQYRAVIVGPCTAFDYSNVAALTVIPLVATVSPTSASICTGTILKLTLTNPTSTPIYGSPSGLPVVVPDGSGAPGLSTISVSNIPPGAVVTDISVRFTLTHTWVGDMDINLKAPNNAIINLVGGLDGGGGGNSTDDFTNTVVSSTSVTPMSGAPAPRTNTFAADARPGYGPTGYIQTTPLWSNLISVLNGNWTLAMGDFGGGDVGTLTSWSIVITYVAPPAQGVWTASPAVPNTMYADAAATVPYVAGTPANSIWVKPTVNTNYSVVYSTATPCVSAPTVIPVSVFNLVSTIVDPVNKSACVGSTATFTTSASGGPLTYQWQVSNNTGVTWTDIPGATSASYTTPATTQVMNNNRYRVTITAGPCGSSTSAAAILTVNPLPVVTISTTNASLMPGQTTTITATSVPAAATASSWSWTLNGAPVSGVTGNSINLGIDGVGAYQARVTDINGCVNFSNILNVSSTASDKLWIYPNPTTGLFQVRVFYDGTVSDRRVLSVIDMNGHVVIQREFDLVLGTPAYLRMDIDATRLPAGTYAVQVKHKVSGKIVSGILVKFNN